MRLRLTPGTGHGISHTAVLTVTYADSFVTVAPRRRAGHSACSVGESPHQEDTCHVETTNPGHQGGWAVCSSRAGHHQRPQRQILRCPGRAPSCYSDLYHRHLSAVSATQG